MNVAFAGDEHGFYGMEVAIYSLLKYTKNVNIYILSMYYERQHPDGRVEQFFPVQEWQMEKLKKIVKYLDPKGSNITFIDCINYYNAFFLNGCNENDGHSSPYATLRLIFDKILPNTSDVLYLDADIVIQEDLNPMYYGYLNQIRSSPYCYAGFTNHLENGRGELVGGVLLFDLKKCKEHNFFERARYNITHKFYQWYDQSAMEDTEHFVELTEKYNYMEKYEYRAYEPAILHFTNHLEPKVYLEPDVFYKKYPHLEYIKKGLNLIDSLPIVSK